MGVRQRLRNQFINTYTPTTPGEAAAYEMWIESAEEGGVYWAALVGLYTQEHGNTALNRACPCTPSMAVAPPGLEPSSHVVHAAVRVEAVRDTFEKTLRRRLSRIRRWIMRHTRRV